MLPRAAQVSALSMYHMLNSYQDSVGLLPGAAGPLSNGSPGLLHGGSPVSAAHAGSLATPGLGPLAGMHLTAHMFSDVMADKKGSTSSAD